VDPATTTVPTADNRKRILIVDDHAAILKVLRTSLEHHGFIVCGEAENGVGAIARATATRPHLIILDVAMPGLNGLEVASILKRVLPDVLIILHTNYAERVGQSQKVLFGIKAVVAKSDGVAKLMECVRSLLASTEAPVQNTTASIAPSNVVAASDLQTKP
jgi:CheY-like chemotaxis protein